MPDSAPDPTAPQRGPHRMRTSRDYCELAEAELADAALLLPFGHDAATHDDQQTAAHHVARAQVWATLAVARVPR